MENKFKKIKYIIVDLDDTLLRKDRTISTEALEIYKKAQEKGYKIVFNTSRSKQNSQKYSDMVHADYGIYSGGCQVVDKDGKELFAITIPAEKVNDIVLKLLKVCEKVSVQTKEHFYASDAEYKAQNAIHYDFSKGFHEDAFKVMCYSMDHDLIEKIANENGLEFQNYLNGGWHRLSIKGANKWNGILRFLEVVNGSKEECMTFGDDFGDMEMIEKAGVGVAMKNSQKEVLEIAPYITKSNDEDGVAYFIATNLLK